METLNIDLPEFESKLVLFSDLGPESRISIDLSTSAFINDGSRIEKPETAEVFLSGTGLANEAIQLIYSEVQKGYVQNETDFDLVEGGQYQINARVKGSPMLEIFAETTIPYKLGVEKFEIIDPEGSNDSKPQKEYVEIDINFQEPKIRPAFLYLEFSFCRDNQNMEENCEDVVSFYVEQVRRGQNAVKRLFHKNGVLVDYSKLSGNNLILKLRKDLTQREIAETGKMIFDLNVVSKEFYTYHYKLSDLLETDQSSYSSINSQFTNVRNGLGLLGSVASNRFVYPMK